MKRGGLLTALAFAMSPLLFGIAADEKPKLETFSGKVVPLGKILEKHKIALDTDAAVHSLALIDKDGKVRVLLKNAGSRAFFKDKRLLDREMQLLGRIVPEAGGLLQVQTIHSVIGGKPHDVYYWCDICSIRRPEKDSCECCGGPMELKEEEAVKR